MQQFENAIVQLNVFTLFCNHSHCAQSLYWLLFYHVFDFLCLRFELNCPNFVWIQSTKIMLCCTKWDAFQAYTYLGCDYGTTYFWINLMACTSYMLYGKKTVLWLTIEKSERSFLLSKNLLLQLQTRSIRWSRVADMESVLYLKITLYRKRLLSIW